MATSPRRSDSALPVAARHLPDTTARPVGPGRAIGVNGDRGEVVAYRLRTVRIAVMVTFMAVGMLGVLPFLPGHPNMENGPYAALAVAALGGALLAWRVVPWATVFAAGWGDWVMYVWSALDIVLVTLVAAATGGPTSSLISLYALTTVFFAASYPGRKQVGLFAMTCACFGGLAVSWSPQPSPAYMFITVGTLSMVWYMAAFLARERNAEMLAHVRSRTLAEHRADLLTVVARTAAAMTTLDSEQVMALVADSLIELGFDVANFCVLDDDRRRYHVRHARLLPGAYATASHSTGVGMVGLVLDRRAAVVVVDYASHPTSVPALRDLGVQSVIAAPIWVEGDIAAVLVAGKLTTPELPTSDAEVFEILAAQVGRTLENARRFEAEHRSAEIAQSASLRDELTGVGNRRQANILLDGLQAGDALLLIDLDKFKGVNDNDGHAAGDQVLIELGAYLQGSVRDADDIARYGGEEFLVVFRDAADTALAAAERLHERWNERGPIVTFSGGVSVHDPSHPATITIGQADVALYQAKQTGRNRVCLYSDHLEDNQRADRRRPGVVAS